MTAFKLPSEGLAILHDRTSKELPQILQLNTIESVTKDILRSIQTNEQVRLKLGKKPVVQYGRKQLNLSHISDQFLSEVFVLPKQGTGPVYFSGRLSHTLEVQKAKQDTAKTDEALAALENTLKSMKEHQAHNEASFMGSNNEIKKKDIKSGPLNNRDRLREVTAPSSPFLGTSPRPGPTSNPLLSSVPTKEKIRQDAMRIPLVHLLAMGPLSAEDAARKLNVSRSECEKVLDKVAKDGSGGKRELKEKCFRELDVWKFPYKNNDDRQAAVEHAIHAYDRMRIDKTDQIWQMLLAKEDRGKDIYLSRLNFKQNRPTVAGTPKLGATSENKVEMSDKEGKQKKTKGSTDLKETLHKKKLSGDTALKKKVEKRVEKPPAKSIVEPTKTDTKFKSAERIEDSDEEAEGAEVVPARPKISKLKERDVKGPPSTRPASSTTVTGPTRSKPPKPSSALNDVDRARLHEDRTKLKPQSKSDRSPKSSQISPRPRVDSSPQKPSPLGSSPPTNSTDLENSSKSSTQSSAPSSPPSSTDMPLSKARKDYSPVIAGKGRVTASQPKRKAEKGEEQPPAKRQQIHGLGLSKTFDRLQQTTPERRSSESSVSSPEKQGMTKERVVKATVKFQEYYNSYKDLHAKLDRVPADERSDRDLDKLWRMHERLEKIKSELWSDWAKAGGE